MRCASSWRARESLISLRRLWSSRSSAENGSVGAAEDCWSTEAWEECPEEEGETADEEETGGEAVGEAVRGRLFGEEAGSSAARFEAKDSVETELSMADSRDGELAQRAPRPSDPGSGSILS